MIGAFFVEWLATLTWSNLLHWHLGVMGMIIMLVVLLFPHGFLESLRRIPLLAVVLPPRHAAVTRAVQAMRRPEKFWIALGSRIFPKKPLG